MRSASSPCMYAMTPGLLLSLCACSEPADDTATPESSPTPSATPQPLNDGPDSEVIVVSDGGTYRIDFLHVDSGEVFYRLDVREVYPECQDTEGACGITEVFHSTHGKRDYLTMNVGQLYQEDGGFFAPATLRRVRLTQPAEPIFNMNQLDFSQVPGGDVICDYDPTDPCNSGTLPTCFNLFPHDVEVVQDDPDAQHLEVILADLATARILKVNYDYADQNRCGVVEWVLDARTEGYEPFYQANDADYFKTADAEYLLTSHYSASPIVSAGAIFMWKRTSESPTWSKLWSFPDPEAGTLPYLNTPHNPALESLEGGGYLMRYGHSRGLESFWHAGYKGSIGMATLDSLESPPVYRGESHFPAGSVLNPMGFVREVEPVGNGRYLVTDSGCETFFGCPLEGRVYLVGGELVPEAQGKSGHWTAGFTEQVFQPLDTTQVRAFDCDFATNYESDYLTRAQLGDDLNAAWRQSVATCTMIQDPVDTQGKVSP